MFRTVIAALATIVLGIGLVSPPAAQAASNAYVVTGHPVSAQPGITEATYLCYDGAPDAAPTRLERDGGTVGASALGWQKTPAGSTVGPRVALAGDPTTLSTFKVDVLAPSGTTGWVHVYFEDNGDGTQLVENDGWAEVTIPASASWQTLDVTSWTYSWDWWIDGEYQGTPTDTVQGFAGDSGAIAQATFDVVLGCNGQPFYLDGLAVAHAAHQVSYDFEKAPAVVHDHEDPVAHDHGTLMTHLEWMTSDKTIRYGDSVTIRYGQTLWMLGHSHIHSASGDSWYSGVGSLYETPARGARRMVLNGAFSPTKYAALRVSPKSKTIYDFAVPAHEDHQATKSQEVTVFVQSRVKAKVLDRSLVQGQKLMVQGSILPKAKGVKVALQRQVGKKWKNVGTTRTKKGGRFAVATRARDAGTWKVRVRVATTGLNIGATTKTATVKVRKYVPPRKNQPPPPPPVDSTPEVPANVTTPPPTQVQATAPQPPPRPPSTGRVASAVAGATAGSVTKGQAPARP